MKSLTNIEQLQCDLQTILDKETFDKIKAALREAKTREYQYHKSTARKFSDTPDYRNQFDKTFQTYWLLTYGKDKGFNIKK